MNNYRTIVHRDIDGNEFYTLGLVSYDENGTPYAYEDVTFEAMNVLALKNEVALIKEAFKSKSLYSELLEYKR
jgi:hypothetical protein